MSALPANLSIWHPAALLGTWFGSGLLPRAPGTWGSLAALPAAWVLIQLGGVAALAIAAIVVFWLGCWASAAWLARVGPEDSRDPGAIVIDEVAGQWIALLGIAVLAEPASWMWWLLAFVLFRIADIAKPWPASWADRNKTAFGLMLDDLFAGIYAALGVGIVAWAVGATGGMT